MSEGIRPEATGERTSTPVAMRPKRVAVQVFQFTANRADRTESQTQVQVLDSNESQLLFEEQHLDPVPARVTVMPFFLVLTAKYQRGESLRRPTPEPTLIPTPVVPPRTPPLMSQAQKPHGKRRNTQL